MTSPQPFSPEPALQALRDTTFDLLVVGGGVTGAGVLLDASARGMKAALVEKGDFAVGTSSKSSKLVHGGLRYLLSARDYGLVHEALVERQRLLANAPHLVSPLPFLIPLFGRDGAVNKSVAKVYSTGLWGYDVIGGLRIGKRHRRIGREEASRMMPTLRTDRLVAGFIYWDARADDARLTLTLARSAVLDHGGVALNHTPVAGVLRDGSGRVNGVRLGGSDLARGPRTEGLEVRAGVVVNAGGVWSDEVRQLTEGVHPDTIRPAKGVHITLPYEKLPTEVAVVLPVPSDRRSVFVVPWGQRVYVGTTDTDYTGSLEDPQCTGEDIRYLLDAVNASVSSPITESDILGSWAGLRPLIKAAATERTADLSRRHAVTTSPDGLVTVTGGKLTTYRRMAADAVDAAQSVLRSGGTSSGDAGSNSGAGRRRSPTKRLRLHGAVDPATGISTLAGTGPEAAEHLVSRHGSDAWQVVALMTERPELTEPLVPGLSYLAAEAVWAVRAEMARTLEDILSRRTRALILDREATAAAAPAVAALVAPELGWTEAETAAETARFLALVDAERRAGAASPA
ncbi:MAG TPA: glycerol-3-phosphate dehydrogenase/oxidase [Acidimicrobiales bacterium]|nr:glycerol-3-phosphate dehydrogenase/oxidase [Acidimicrobiales bacterium]